MNTTHNKYEKIVDYNKVKLWNWGGKKITLKSSVLSYRNNNINKFIQLFWDRLIFYKLKSYKN